MNAPIQFTGFPDKAFFLLRVTREPFVSRSPYGHEFRRCRFCSPDGGHCSKATPDDSSGKGYDICAFRFAGFGESPLFCYITSYGGGMSSRNATVAISCDPVASTYRDFLEQSGCPNKLLLINMLVGQENFPDTSILAQFLHNMTVGILL